MPWKGAAQLGLLLCSVILGSAIKLPQDAPVENPEVCIRRINSSRKEVTAVLAVMTTLGQEGARRRKMARDTWFPANQQEMERLFLETGIVLRFAVGKSSKAHMRDLAAEEAKYGDFIHLADKEQTNSDSIMVVGLWEVVTQQYKARYVIKAEDDSYVRMDRLVQAVFQWDRLGAGYVGCMHQRDDGQVLKALPSQAIYDPHRLIYDGDNTFVGDAKFMAVEGRVIDGIIRSGLSLRTGGQTDVMVGWVMKAFNVSHFDDRRLCYTTQCDLRMVVYHWGRAIAAAGAPSPSSPDDMGPSVCCPTADQCSPLRSRADVIAQKCLAQLHGGDPACATPTLGLNDELDLILDVDRHRHMRSDWEWVSAHPVSVMQSLDNN